MLSADAEFERRVGDDLAALRERGSLIVQSGSARTERFEVSAHSDLGPPELDKTGVNQDYGLVWINPTPGDGQPDWVAAVADGLTSSFWSDRAATLASLGAVRWLVERGGGSVAALKAARGSLSRYSQWLRDDAEYSQPRHEVPFLSTWKYMLEKGTLLRTTLNLAWYEHRSLRLVTIGDGGALLVEPGRNRTLAACDLETERVNALGPVEGQGTEVDVEVEVQVDAPYRLALFSDGIGRGLGTVPERLWKGLSEGEANPAQQFIERACREQAEAYADNLTLVLIRGLTPRG